MKLQKDCRRIVLSKNRDEDMARQMLKAKQKKTQKITKYGLLEKNHESGEQTNISNKVSDFSLDRKQNAKEKQQNVQEKEGGRTARLISYKKKQQRKQIQKAQLENEAKKEMLLYQQNFEEEKNTPTFQQEMAEKKQQEQQKEKHQKKTDVNSERNRTRQKVFVINKSKKRQRKTTENSRTNDFSLQQTKEKANNLQFSHTKNKKEAPQKLKFQHQEYEQENNISKRENQKNKMRFSKQEQQNIQEQNIDKKVKMKKLQYYSSEKREAENKQNQQNITEKEILLNQEGKKEISAEDKRKLEKLEHKVQKAQQDLEKAEQKLPKKTKIKFEKSFDENTKKTKIKWRIEGEAKPQAKPNRNIIKKAAVMLPRSLWYKGHEKIAETEKENTGVEAAHKNEQRGEFLVKTGYRKWHNNRKNKPYSTVTKMEKRLQKANTKYHTEKFSVEHPKIEPNKMNQKWIQKQKIKKKYAQMLRQKQNTEVRTVKDVLTQIIRAVSQAVSTQKTAIGIAAVVGVLFILSSSLFSSCSAMLSGAGTSTFAAAYTANDGEINAADLYYTELETNLQYTINHIEETYSNYDEYRYNIGEIGHNPYKLMAYLSAMYDFFTFEDIKNDIEELFHKQYKLQIIPKTEIRYDSDGNTYDWHVLEVTLAVKPMEQTTIPLLNQYDCKYKYDVYMETYGNRQNFGNPFSFSWLSYVSGQYGYRLNEQGEKELHRGIDFAIPQDTSIFAIHTGIVTEVSSNSVLGNYIVIEDDKGYKSIYAGWQRCHVTVGKEVKKGEEIALIGNISFHLEVTHQGQYLNPMYFVDNGDDGKGALPGTEGGIVIPDYPGNAMGDGSFQGLLTEAEKYLGYPYVWGGSNPNTSFDCSGFICWVYTQSGVHNLLRTTAQGIYNQCTPVSEENAKPGDLIFFTGTYDSVNPVSHIGIYVGNGQMLHAGDPISYANINSKYWKQHFYGFGRLY